MDVLKANLFKTYSAIEIHRDKWNDILKSVDSSLNALSSLGDQLDCVLKVQPCELSTKFPYLKVRLEQNIRSLMEEELHAVLLSLEELDVLNHKLKSSCEVTYKFYLENFNTIHKDPSFYQGTSMCPPVSQMLEWLDDINMCYSNKLFNAKHLLEVFDYTPEKVTNLQNLIKSKKDFSSVESIMTKVYLFLQEK